jgi:hypothetical protein
MRYYELRFDIEDEKGEALDVPRLERSEDFGEPLHYLTGERLNASHVLVKVGQEGELRDFDMPMNIHPQGACGAAGVAATIIALRSGILHPTLNLDAPDPRCDLDYIPHTPREARVDLALCNCIAFGSKNSALVLRRAAL